MGLEKYIGMFKENYVHQVVSGVRCCLESNHNYHDFLDAFQNSKVTNKSTVYIFGNGGSYALGKHFELSLRGNKFFPIRVRNGIDTHASLISSEYNDNFCNLMKAELVDSEDFVILISGSGDSENIVRAVEYCKFNNIPNTSFSGFGGGKVSEIAQYPIIAHVNDQQISEDVLQILLNFAGQIPSEDRFHRNEVNIDDYIATIEKGINETLQSEDLDKISDNIIRCFNENKTVYLLAPEGGSLAVTAEHTAHNLNWDAIYHLEKPPKRNIVSTPTGCDYSGIANDRKTKGIVTLQQLEKSTIEDYIIFFVFENGEIAENVISGPEEYGFGKCCMFGGEYGTPLGDTCFETYNPYLLSDILQITGHMLGRIVNAKLRGIQESDTMSFASYLMSNDLAQRRLIDKDGI